MPNLRTLVLLIVSALLTIHPAGAQQAGTLRGVLTDSSGAVIPGATVSITAGDVRKTAATGGDGSYSFPGLAAGEYNISVEFPGFDPFRKTVAINAGITLQVPIQLQLNAGRQEVTVTAQGGDLSVDPEHSAAAVVMSDTDLDALPDDPDDLSTMLQQLAGPGAGGTGGTQILLDGFSGGQLPPKAAIKEIRINQNPFSAEYDNIGFGRIEIITKPGADKFRGGAGLTDSDAAFNSRNPYAANKADYVNRMFTGNLAGPVSHKASFTLSFFQSKIDNTALIDAVTLDPVTLANVPIQSTVTTPRTDIGGTGRMDAQLSTNNTLTGTYQYNRSNRDNNGIGQYNLVSREYSSANTRHEVHLTETRVLNSSAVTETRFGYIRNMNNQFGDNSVPSVNVTAAFVGGGAQVGNASNLNWLVEFQNNTTVIRGTHTFRFGGRGRHYGITDSSPANFGGTFTFFGVNNAPVLDANNQVLTDAIGQAVTTQISSLEQYRRTLLFQRLGYPAALIRSLGGGASQFSLAAGNPLAAIGLSDFGFYAIDDWRVKPNFTVSLGLRYEWQSNFGDYRDIAPRFGIAWSPGAKNGTAAKTVIRAGAGLFYNRINFNLNVQQARFNGVNQQQFLVTNPDFFPNVPQVSALLDQRQPSNTYRFDANLRAPALPMWAVTLERQLPAKSTISVTYFGLRGTHLLQTVNINSPLPGTYDPTLPDSGVRPYGNAAGNLFTWESGGNINQEMAWLQLNNRISKKFSMTTYYTLMFANGNIDGPGYPSNPYNFKQDYGRSGYERRHSFNMVGSITAPLGIQFNPILVMSSGAPYDLTIGGDLNGDTIANDRPAFATDLSRPSVVKTRFGAFDTSPMPGQTLVPRNYLTSSGMWNLNSRVGRTFGFGKKKDGVQAGATPGTDRRFSVNLNVEVNNVFNHLNQGGYVGNLSSPLFGQSTSIYLFRDTSNNRRVQFGTQFTF